MYIAQALKYQSDFWRYIIGSIVVIFANFVAQVPFVIALIIKDQNILNRMDVNTMMTTLDSNLTLLLLMIPFAVSLVALYFVVKYLHQQPFKTITTTRKKTDWNRIFFSFFLWGVITAIFTFADYYTNPTDYEWNFDLVPFLILFVLAIILIPIQTSLEEYLFRGYLMQGFGVLFKNRWLPLLFTSLIFGGLHIANPEVDKIGYVIMVFYIGTGLFLGIMTLMDEGMELALGFHAANNLVAALLVTADWTAFQTNSVLKDISDPSAGWDIMIPVFVVFPILLFIMAKKYKWSNWKEKLFGVIQEENETNKI
ncbi:CPBP family intramembrane glutamic endopeptidase [Spongiivirga sp. MCCC 1A20706]|uniref:CPBP family intramembrane glutamic endopeptidase n=1 Tax=Spongiivirga sp. MCCC 1A20706 TaxID=3160963 RepID=UPI00397769F0